jgi:hypothetical protein
MTPHWIRCSGLTLGLLIDSTGIIVDAPDLVDGFIGQPLKRLLDWLEPLEKLDDLLPGEPPGMN